MLFRYLFVLCLSTSPLLAASFKFGVTCSVDDKKHIFCLSIDEDKPRQTVSGDLNFTFAILSSDERQIAVQTIVERKSAENGSSTLIAQPIIVTPFDSSAGITCDEPNIKLTLVASKK